MTANAMADGRDWPRETTDHQTNRADGFVEENQIGERQGRFDPTPRQTAGEGSGTRAGHFENPVNKRIPPTVRRIKG
jgi:hypothetical protein